MRMKDAFAETLLLAAHRGMPDLPGSELGLNHLYSMWDRIQESDFSEAKLGRWLGWAQCAVVAAGAGTLEEMKGINLSHSGDSR